MYALHNLCGLYWATKRNEKAVEHGETALATLQERIPGDTAGAGLPAPANSGGEMEGVPARGARGRGGPESTEPTRLCRRSSHGEGMSRPMPASAREAGVLPSRG